MRYCSQAAFVSAGGYHHHIGLNTWRSKMLHLQSKMAWAYTILLSSTPPVETLHKILDRVLKEKYPLTGTSDHEVSEALYLDDPDGNGIALYWDKPAEHWP